MTAELITPELVEALTKCLVAMIADLPPEERVVAVWRVVDRLPPEERVVAVRRVVEQLAQSGITIDHHGRVVVRRRG